MTSSSVVLLTALAGWRGSATSFLKIALGLASRGSAVRAIVGGPDVAAQFANAGVPTEVASYRHTGLRAALDLARRLSAARCDVLIVDTPRDLRIGVLAARLAGARVLYRYNLSYRAPHTGIVERTFLRRAAGCVFQSRAVRREFVRVYPSLVGHPYWLIPNGYSEAAGRADPARVAALREQLRLVPDRPVIVSGAVLAGGKGHELLFDAAQQMMTAGVAYSLVVCGGGGDSDRIEADARARSLPVQFTGSLDAVGMRAAYSLADIVVHPSEREVFPNVVAEAMAIGRAVIAVDSWGTQEVLGDAGVLVPPDAAALASATLALCVDPHRRARLAAAGQRRVRDHFPLERMVDGYARVVAALAQR